MFTMAKTASGGTRADDVQQHLRADILGGRRTPGERLKFPELCEQYEVSAGVIREALTRLVDQGLVRAQAHQGYVVTPLSHKELGELTVARMELESLVFRLSVVEGDMSWEGGAVAAHHVLERAPFAAEGDPSQLSEEWSGAHAAFHVVNADLTRILLQELDRQRLRGLRRRPNRGCQGRRAALGRRLTVGSQALERAVNLFLAGQISANTRSTLERQSADPQIVQIKSAATTQVNLGTITGLVLGTPEFQQR